MTANDISALVGKTISAIDRNGDKSLTFQTADGEEYVMYHEQDCCESVSIEDLNGDLEDLIGSPILLAEENSSTEQPDGVPEPKYADESRTWTFYRIGTLKGTVVIRWFGSSNGYSGQFREDKMTATAAARQADPAGRVNEWNRKYPPGTQVRLRRPAEGWDSVIGTTAGPAYLEGTSPVVIIDGLLGVWQLDQIEAVNP